MMVIAMILFVFILTLVGWIEDRQTAGLCFICGTVGSAIYAWYL